MPLEYRGISHEHLAVRSRAGLFDVSHMGQIETRGPDAERLLQLLTSADVRRLGERGAQYAVVCREDGGVLDDVITYRLAPDRFLTVTNASNHERDLSWWRSHAAGWDCEVVDRASEWAMLAAQGPQARRLLAALTVGELPPRMRCAEVRVADVEVLACGTGYTGEDGVELLCRPQLVEPLWDALLAAGFEPCGLGARDTLRIEACLPLYGNELDERRTPREAGLDFCLALETGFIGAAAIEQRVPRERLVPFVMCERAVPRQGYAVSCEAGGGVVTSGTFSPYLRRGIGLAYLPLGCARVGCELAVDVRGKPRRAAVAQRPLHRTHQPA